MQMKRIAFVLIATALLLAVLVIVFTAEFKPQFPPEGQALLDDYLALSPETTVQAISLAGHPEKLTQDMVDRLDGDQEPQDLEVDDIADQPVIKPIAGGSLRFPPQETWCILLDRGGKIAGEVLFVTRHENLYGSQWALYRGLDRASSPSSDQVSATIGCSDVSGPVDAG
jgi:hypothetical protein